MAISNYEYNTYLPEVKVTANGTDYTFPIWNLKLTVFPWNGESSPAQKLADGTHYQKVTGWHVEAQFDMNMGWHADMGHCDVGNMVADALDAGTVVIDFDPVDNPATRTLTMVLKNPEDAIQTAFSGKVRSRPSSFTFITESLISTGAIPAWIAGD